MIASGDGGYALAVEPSEVDALARAARRRRRVASCSTPATTAAPPTLSASALERYRGRRAAGAGDGDWVAPHRARLEEARMKLLETQFSARLRLGDVGDVIGELEAAVATYPYQEGLWELLITALYRAGRQADALATYQRVRTRLADELGLDPGPRLQQLEQQILDHDPARPRPPTARPPGTCRRCRPSWSAARRRSPPLADLLAQRAARRDRRAGRHRQDGGRDRDRSQRWPSRPAASGWPGSRPRRRPTTSSTR